MPPRSWRDFLPFPRIVLFIAILACVLVTRLAAGALALPPGLSLLGLLLAALGLGLVAWALWTLDVGMLGGVETLAPRLVTWGPYRFARHPTYVGMALALLGYAVAAASWAGLLAVIAVYLPAATFRAGREERALARRFGAEWRQYRARVGAWAPRIPPPSRGVVPPP